MHPRSTTSHRADRRPRSARHRTPTSGRRPGVFAAAAAAGAVLVHVLVGGDPAAQAEAGAAEPVSVAQELGLTAGATPVDVTEHLRPLEALAASRSNREAEQSAAQHAQAAADQVALDRRKAEEAARAAAEQAARAAAETAARQEVAARQAAGSARAQAAAPRAGTAAGTVARISNRAGNVTAVAQAAANMVVSNVPGVAAHTIGGTRASAADPDGHPSGRALDYMTGTDSALGDAVAAYHIAHWDELKVEYVIWRQRMLSSPNGSWKQMEDRGGATANHLDHVHVNYRG